jgi:hypothetical protein
MRTTLFSKIIDKFKKYSDHLIKLYLNTSSNLKYFPFGLSFKENIISIILMMNYHKYYCKSK